MRCLSSSLLGVSSGKTHWSLGHDRLEEGIDVRIGCQTPEAVCSPVINLDLLPYVLEINMPLFLTCYRSIVKAKEKNCRWLYDLLKCTSLIIEQMMPVFSQVNLNFSHRHKHF